MITEILITLGVAAIFVLLYFSFGYFSARSKRRGYIQRVQEEVSAVKNKQVFVEYKGYQIPMSEFEKRTIWKNLTTQGKKDALAAFKRLKKEGKI